MFSVDSQTFDAPEGSTGFRGVGRCQREVYGTLHSKRARPKIAKEPADGKTNAVVS